MATNSDVIDLTKEALPLSLSLPPPSPTQTTKCWWVYAIESPSKQRSYVGATTNFKRRLRQHNSEITGGAKYTRSAQDWRYLYRVQGFENTEALKFEWWLKHSGKKTGKRKRFARASGRGVTGRILNLQRVLNMEIWKNKQLTITWCQEDVRPSSFSPPSWKIEEEEVEEDDDDDYDDDDDDNEQEEEEDSDDGT